MRHVILFVLAIAAAFWLAPALHVLPQHARGTAIAVILAVFVAADLAIGLAARRRKAARTPARPAARYAAPARRR
jgi:hypothetical protein